MLQNGLLFRAWQKLKGMPHFKLFRLEVALVVLVRLGLYRQLLYYFEPEALEAVQLFRIVRKEPYSAKPQISQYLRPRAEIALVGLEAEREVRFDGVLSFLLQFVC